MERNSHGKATQLTPEHHGFELHGSPSEGNFFSTYTTMLTTYGWLNPQEWRAL